MGLTTEKMSGKTLSKPLKWNSHPSPLCQNISKPLSRKTFFQDYLWQSYSLYISKRYEVRLRWKRASDGSENSRDLSLLKWFLYSKTPNLTRFWVWKARQCFHFICFKICKFYYFIRKLLWRVSQWSAEKYAICTVLKNSHWFWKNVWLNFPILFKIKISKTWILGAVYNFVPKIYRYKMESQVETIFKLILIQCTVFLSDIVENANI